MAGQLWILCRELNHVEMLLQKRRRRDSSPDCTAGHVVNGQRDRPEGERKYPGGYEAGAREVDCVLDPK